MKYLFIFLLALPFLLIIGCNELPTDNLEKLPKATTPTSKTDIYVYMVGDESKGANLITIQSWEGDKPARLNFETDKSPWILNCSYYLTSEIAHNFDIQIVRETTGLSGKPITINMHPGRILSALVNSSGKYTIYIESSGCEWWVNIGIE